MRGFKPKTPSMWGRQQHKLCHLRDGLLFLEGEGSPPPLPKNLTFQMCVIFAGEQWHAQKFFVKSNKGPRCYKARVVYKSWQPEKVRQLFCQVLPVTFISSRVKICQGNDVYQVPQPSIFQKTLAT